MSNAPKKPQPTKTAEKKPELSEKELNKVSGGGLVVGTLSKT